MKPYFFLIYLLTCTTGFIDGKTYYLELNSTEYGIYGYLGSKNKFDITLDEEESLSETIIQVKSTNTNIENSEVFTYTYPNKKNIAVTTNYPLYLLLVNPTIDEVLKGNEIQVIAKTTECSFYPSPTPTTSKVAKSGKSLSTSTFWDNLNATATISYNQNVKKYTLSFNLPVFAPQSGAYIFSGYTAYIQK